MIKNMVYRNKTTHEVFTLNENTKHAFIARGAGSVGLYLGYSEEELLDLNDKNYISIVYNLKGKTKDIYFIVDNDEVEAVTVSQHQPLTEEEIVLVGELISKDASSLEASVKEKSVIELIELLNEHDDFVSFQVL